METIPQDLKDTNLASATEVMGKPKLAQVSGMNQDSSFTETKATELSQAELDFAEKTARLAKQLGIDKDSELALELSRTKERGLDKYKVKQRKIISSKLGVLDDDDFFEEAPTLVPGWSELEEGETLKDLEPDFNLSLTPINQGSDTLEFIEFRPHHARLLRQDRLMTVPSLLDTAARLKAMIRPYLDNKKQQLQCHGMYGAHRPYPWYMHLEKTSSMALAYSCCTFLFNIDSIFALSSWACPLDKSNKQARYFAQAPLSLKDAQT